MQVRWLEERLVIERFACTRVLATSRELVSRTTVLLSIGARLTMDWTLFGRAREYTQLICTVVVFRGLRLNFNLISRPLKIK